MNKKTCKRCYKEDEDLRTLWMECSYNMDELQIPLEKEVIREGGVNYLFYTIIVCKRCRADWLDFILMWYGIKLNKYDAKGSGIFIRHFGENIEVSEEKFREIYPDREPVRVIKND